MSRMDQQAKLVNLLWERTRKGNLEWNETEVTDVFQVSFKDNSVRVSAEDVLRNEALVTDIRFSFFNSAGEMVETFTDVELTESGPKDEVSWYDKMKETHEMARRVALGTDKVLRSIIEELEGDSPDAK